MIETGKNLKKRREVLGVSIAEVSIATKITPRMIQAIEAAESNYLPARTFLRGFVKSYAQFLKMDIDATLKFFNDEMNALEPQAAPTGPLPQSEKAPSQVQSEHQAGLRATLPPVRSMGKQFLWAIGLICLLSSIFFVRQLVQKYEREGKVDETNATLAELEPVVETTNDKAEDKNTETTATTADTEKEVVAPPVAAEKPPTTEVAKTPEPVKAVEVAKPSEETKPVEPAKPPAVEAAKPVEPAKAAATPAQPEKAKKGAVQEIIIEALDKVDVRVNLGNGQDRKISLAPSQVHTIKTAGAFSIEISDGGAVNIIYNGRDVGVPGDLGRPKVIQFP